MAEDMIERAAKAIWETFNQGPEWDKRREPMKEETRKEARAALLAALDPEDEALVERFAYGRYLRAGGRGLAEWFSLKKQAPTLGGNSNAYTVHMKTARQDIAALQNMVDEPPAQGERAE